MKGPRKWTRAQAGTSSPKSPASVLMTAPLYFVWTYTKECLAQAHAEEIMATGVGVQVRAVGPRFEVWAQSASALAAQVAK